MGEKEDQVEQTQHAFLVAWGQFAEEIGLIAGIEGVKLGQKTYRHSPQEKVLEFLVGILSGMKQLQDISLAAHPLDKDQAVAKAWGQSGWADYSGVSRTMSSLSWEEAYAIAQVLEQVSQPFLEAELAYLRTQGERVRIDGDLTGIPVSNTSRSYPNAAFGHMDDEVRLGYQAGVVSLVSPTYGRLWLSGTHHPGDTVSSTQAESLILAAEANLGLRPKRRTDLLEGRIAGQVKDLESVGERLKKQQEAYQVAQHRWQQAQEDALEQLKQLESTEQLYQSQRRPERPTSKLAVLRKRYQAAQKRYHSREKVCQTAQRKLSKTEAQLDRLESELTALRQRLEQFEQDNATNPNPIEAEIRLDAGFGTYSNITLLIEMGYEVYTKPLSHKVAQALRKNVQEPTGWTRVGDNAEMIAWPTLQLKNCPYPLDMALERFYTGNSLKHSALCHFGRDPVTCNLPAWFDHYNGRQTIEAGIKEGKQVFLLHRIKVRSEPAIFLQERFVLFAANFVRWATRWLGSCPQPQDRTLDISSMGIKRQVQVAAHVSAQVIRHSDGILLRFSEQSAFSGKVLLLPGRG